LRLENAGCRGYGSGIASSIPRIGVVYKNVSSTCLLLAIEDVPEQRHWLQAQAVPVIAVGSGEVENADTCVPDESSAAALLSSIDKSPVAAQVLVQVLRTVEHLPLQSALTLESMAYGLLQAGAEHRAWLDDREQAPALLAGGGEPAITVAREGDIVRATLNRPEQGNSLSVEMRDALVEVLELVSLDNSIERLELRAAGRCFSTGGELREFGLASDPADAHRIRSIHSPGRLLAGIAARVHCTVHGACIGSGIELPAFAGRVTALGRTFFQLPELQMGLIPGAGGCVSISRRIGRQRTAWLALSGRRINARTALEWGLVDETVDETVGEKADEIVAG